MEDSLETQLFENKRKIDFNSYDISAKELLSMVKDGYIDISPEYQRHFRWGLVKQSLLIESVFLGIPIPSLFMATNSDGTWEVVDGVQRLSSLMHFIGDDSVLKRINVESPLQITGLEKLSQLNHHKFADLPRNIRMNFELSPIKITTLSDKSDKRVRFDLFERLNTGGVELSDQEIRNCINRGEFSDLLKELSKDSNFLDVVKLAESSEHDGTRQEMVLRFFAYLYNYKNFEHSVVNFLNDFMTDSTKNFKYEKSRKIFELTFSRLKIALPEGITRGRKIAPINLYEAISVGTALALIQNPSVSLDKLSEFMATDNMKKLTTGATNSNIRVKARIDFVKNFLLEN